MAYQTSAQVVGVRRSNSHPDKDVILVSFTKENQKEGSAQFHVPHDQHSVGDVLTVYIRDGRVSLT